MKYLVQAILVDGDRETVVDSVRTDNGVRTMNAFMKRHRNSYKYVYNVMTIDTGHLIISTRDNIYQHENLRVFGAL